MRRTRYRIVQTLSLLGAVLGPAACVGARGPAAPPPQDAFLAADIQRTTAVTAYDAVRSLRPAWLRRRGRSSIQNASAEIVVVYLNGVRYGGPESLRSIAAGTVLEIRHLDASDATTRFGTGHGGGALLVRTK